MYIEFYKNHVYAG